MSDDATRTAAHAVAADTPTWGEVPTADETGPPAVGRYDHLEELARGGMGIVYRARDPDLSRDVAVKLMHASHRGSPAAVRRFTDEATITGQLQHPGIPPVFEVGRLPDGSPFLAMKLIRGRTLDDILKDRPDPSHERGRHLAIFEQVCQAVGYAHAHDVIHRDLKPANVMVGVFGEVQVMDWGLAKVLMVSREAEPSANPDASLVTEIRSTRGAGDETQAGSLLGTPAYMPPEQAIGAVDQVDRRSDVFGLGAILCTVLTGKPPYVGADGESTRQLAASGKLDDAFARLAACRAEPELVALCRRCLNPEMAGRPTDAGEVAAAVAAHRAAADERARRAELDRVRAEAEATEQRKRRRVQLALAAVAGLLLAGGGVVAWWQGEVKAERARTEGERFAEDARRAEQESARAARNAAALAELVERCEAALRAEDAKAAAAALTEIDRRLPEGGGEALAGAVARCRRDVALLRELDGIAQYIWSSGGLGVTGERVAAKYRAAFAEAGLEVRAETANDVARRIGASPLRDRLTAVLDFWLMFTRDAAVRQVLRSTDPDPYRDSVRDAFIQDSSSRLVAVAKQPEALLQSAGFASVLGQARVVPAARRRAILESAVRTNPRDVNVLMVLGSTVFLDPVYQTDGKAKETEMVRWFQAAVTAAPDNPAANLMLGIGCMNFDLDAAEVHIRKAHRLDAKLQPIRLSLFAVLRQKGDKLAAAGDRDGAGSAYHEALALNRDGFPAGVAFSPLYVGLGHAHRQARDAAGTVAAYRAGVEHDPKNAVARNELAYMLAVGPDGVRDGKQAVEHAVRACELTAWKDPNTIATLAFAHAEVGDFEKAIEYQKRALASPEYEKIWGAVARKRLEGFAQKQPVRDRTLVPYEPAPPPRPAMP